MSSLEIVLGLMVAVTVLALVARRANVPYPIVLVLGGLVLAVIPGLPAVKLAPDLVFLVFLPPLITSAGWYTSVRDLKANRRAIGLLSVGLVVFTTLGVGAAAHFLVPGLGWGPALVLGAIVSPTDAIAATAIMDRLGAPHRIVAILEARACSTTPRAWWHSATRATPSSSACSPGGSRGPSSCSRASAASPSGWRSA